MTFLDPSASNFVCFGTVPEMRVYNQPRFAIADLKLPSLLEFDAACWEKLNKLVY